MGRYRRTESKANGTKENGVSYKYESATPVEMNELVALLTGTYSATTYGGERATLNFPFERYRRPRALSLDALLFVLLPDKKRRVPIAPTGIRVQSGMENKSYLEVRLNLSFELTKLLEGRPRIDVMVPVPTMTFEMDRPVSKSLVSPISATLPAKQTGSKFRAKPREDA